MLESKKQILKRDLVVKNSFSVRINKSDVKKVQEKKILCFTKKKKE